MANRKERPGTVQGNRGLGRPRNSKNKITADIKAIAQAYGEEAIISLVEMVRDSEAPHAARVSAAKEVLDRGYGKSIQTTDLQNSDGSLRHPGYAVTPDRAKTMESWTQNVASQTPKDA